MAEARNHGATPSFEAWVVSFVLPRFDLGICCFDNPLSADADVVELVVAGQKLVRSPAAHAWSRKTAEEFASTAGLWVTCHGPVAQLISGSGSPSELIGLPGPAEQYEEAQFFVVPTELVDLVDVDCELTVIYTG